MDLPEFPSRDVLKRLWWAHDAFWHGGLVRALGRKEANRLNLETSEKLFRLMTATLLRARLIQRPKGIEDLMGIFRTVWKNAFFDDLYIEDPVTYAGNRATWIGTRCHAYDSLRRADMLEGYACGCQALRNGVMRTLRLRPLHEIRESLLQGHGRCVIEVTFEPLSETQRPPTEGEPP